MYEALLKATPEYQKVAASCMPHCKKTLAGCSAS